MAKFLFVGQGTPFRPGIGDLTGKVYGPIHTLPRGGIHTLPPSGFELMTS
jgi:hypothetical protein